MIDHSFKTTVVISVPVNVSGYYDKHGEFHVEEVTLQFQYGKDVMPSLGPTDIEELQDKAQSAYPEVYAQHRLEMVALAVEARKEP